MLNTIEHVFKTGLESVKGSVLVQNSVSLDDDILRIKTSNQELSYYLPKYDNIYLIGVGKASAFMASKIEDLLGERIANGLIVTKYLMPLEKLETVKAGHPTPDENSIVAAKKILEICKNAKKNDLVINLISGGASALVAMPEEQISLEELREVNHHLIKSGASIDEINSVRINISKIKGGKLLDYVYPAEIVSLIISDVIGDRIEIIGSGLTVPVDIPNSVSLDIIDKYNIKDNMPKNVIDFLKKDKAERVSTKCKYKNVIIGNNRTLLKKLGIIASNMGYVTKVIDFNMQGEAREIGRKIAEDALNFFKSSDRDVSKKYCFLYGGETTVNVTGTGKGGRNQELALSAAIALKDSDGISILSGGSDGDDGMTDVAGVACDGTTYSRGVSLGIKAEEYLDNNDSYNYFKAVGGLIDTGHTGTNVMDVVIVLV